MNAFEALVADCLRADGYWTFTEFKVNLSKLEKREIGRPSSPRWELDIIAYQPMKNELIVVECKSYLDSNDVNPDDFSDAGKHKDPYKLFTDPRLWPVVSKRLQEQLEALRLIRPDAKICLGLAYGYSPRERILSEKFERGGWRLFGPDWIRGHIHRVAKAGWQNSTTSIVAKLLARA